MDLQSQLDVGIQLWTSIDLNSVGYRKSDRDGRIYMKTVRETNRCISFMTIGVCSMLMALFQCRMIQH